MSLRDGSLRSLVHAIDHGETLLCPYDELCRLVLSHMLQALDFLTCKGIIHRDVKPDNILYTDQGGYEFQLADFGVSNYLIDAMTIHTGTHLFMSPEIY